MERVFQKLLMAYGNQLMAKWQGINLQDVYADWAERMQGLSLGSINYGIEISKGGEHPPSQGEFINNCKGYKPAELLKIESKLTPEQREANKQRIADMVKNLSRSKQA
jgi:hypothetical protein